MILYDQDFNFIGMDSETLTFLGYEDLDEFTSMHADFADLFVPKEGFIHKFENFSWIHYILFSGAANKKAFVRQKNGSEVTVDITIKEIFLTDKYEGLRKIYGIKLINENFTAISKSDVHDKRSKMSSEFSLKKITGNIESSTATSTSEPEKEVAAVATVGSADTATAASHNTNEAPQEFLLDIPEEMLSAPKKETAHTVLEERTEPSLPQEERAVSGDFILKSPPPASDDAQNLSEAFLTENGSEEVKTDQALFQKIESETELHATQSETHTEPETAVSSDKAAEPEKRFSFDLLKKSDETQNSDYKEASSSESEKEETPSPFSFNLADESSKQTDSEEIDNNETEKQSTASEQSLFSFSLFKNENNDDSSQKAEEHVKEVLIDQIKSDIAEIDAEAEVTEEEQQDAATKLQNLLLNRNNENQRESQHEDFHKENSLVAETSANTATDAEENKSTALPSEPESFEARLNNIFSLADKLSSTEEDRDNGKKINIFNSEEEVANHKHSVTKESIKSSIQETATDRDTQMSDEELILPELGKLGLSKEEELDFIDEFLNDTEETIGLMREYLRLKDFDNIRYTLIKISSSAEILHFDQLLTYTQSMSSLCKTKDAEQLADKLSAFENLIGKYREHFSRITA